MISRAKIKWVKSLQLKKYRIEEQSFVVQGLKSVQELLDSNFQIELIAGTTGIMQNLEFSSEEKRGEWISVSAKELDLMGTFQTNDSVLAVAKMKENLPMLPSSNEFVLALDDIRDPGNLGTIVRTADWFGISKIVASASTTDIYNPKTISATMGSFCRVGVTYTDLPAYLSKCSIPVFGAFLEGANVHSENFGAGGILVIGNESNGISESVKKWVTQKVFIPGFGKAESLNAAIAAGIILDNVFRGKG